MTGSASSSLAALTILLCGCASPDYGPTPALMRPMSRVRFNQKATQRDADERQAERRSIAEWRQNQDREQLRYQLAQTKTNRIK